MNQSIDRRPQALQSESIESESQPITGYHRDDESHWVAQLACGHNQHVRHDPPLVRRDWTQSAEGRRSMIGHELQCKKCYEKAPMDDRPESGE